MLYILVIYVFYTRFVSRLKTELFNLYLHQLPGNLQSKILKYRKWQDSQRSLLGKALLLKGLDYLSLSKYSLYDLKFTKLERPYFDNFIDFNISHAGEYVICAISLTGKIGVDVEDIQDISIEDFENNFSSKEWEDILKASNKLYSFYEYWTKKEAFLKAIGIGLNIPLNKTEILDNRIIFNNTEWFLNEIKIDERYISHFSSQISVPEVIIRKIDFD